MTSSTYKLQTPPEAYIGSLVKSLAIGKGDFMMAEAYAVGQGYDAVAKVCKAAVAPTSLSDLPNAMRPFNQALVELMRPFSLETRLTSLRRVPLGASVVRWTGGARATFAGEARPFALSSEALETERLEPYELIAGIVVSDESLRSLSPDGNKLVANDTARAVAEAFDRRWLDPTYAAAAGVSPASITNGATRFSSSGSSVAAIDSDLMKMVRVLTASGKTLATAAWLMSSATAAFMATVRGTSGAPAYPLIGAQGGSLLGLPVYTSGAIASAGSPGESYILCLEQSEVVIGVGETRIDTTQNASVQMSDTPATGAQQLVSLWQNNLTGIRARRDANWSASTGSVAVLVDVAF